MDGPRFDDLTRALGAASSRRTLLRATVTAAIGVLGLRRAETAHAQACLALGARCRPTDQCCTGECHGRKCRCRPHQQECGGACFDPCPAGRVRDASCACSCPGDTVPCAGECRGLGTFEEDVQNCGACGNRCPAGACKRAICHDGECGVEADPALVGTACTPVDLCSENGVCGADGSCVGTPKDCGNCRICQGGQCFPRPDGSPCLGGAFRCCGGICIQPCGIDQECCGGACYGPCPTGATRGADCACACPPELPSVCNPGTFDAYCANFQTDWANCGGCGETCADHDACVAGVCTACPATCAPGSPCCDGWTCDAFGFCRLSYRGPGELCEPGYFDCPYGYWCNPDLRICEACTSGSAGCDGVDTVSCNWDQQAACCAERLLLGFPGFGYCCAPGILCLEDPDLPECPGGWGDRDAIAGLPGPECFKGWR